VERRQIVSGSVAGRLRDENQYDDQFPDGKDAQRRQKRASPQRSGGKRAGSLEGAAPWATGEWEGVLGTVTI
jgi:hypothetical protein